ETTGIAAIPIVSATIIGDLFEGKERGEAMSLYQMLLALAPAMAPLIGGYLGSINSHLSVFLFLSTLGIILLIGLGFFKGFHQISYSDVYNVFIAFCIGLLISVICYQMIKHIYSLLVKYLKWNLAILQRY
ncbi:MFS transporter, partial [Bacillus sp. SS-TM]